MPDGSGNFRGTGWSRKGEAAWDRVFGRADVAALQARRHAWLHDHAGEPLPPELLPVPTEPPSDD